MIVFETSRLMVRHFRPGDEDAFFLLNGDEEVVRYIRKAKTREESDIFFKEVLASTLHSPNTGRMAVEDKDTGCIIGSFALISIEGTDCMQLGYSFIPAAWGKGYATELTVAGVRYAFERTSINPLYAQVEKGNDASSKVLLKAGFRENGSKLENGKEILQYHIDLNRL